MRRSTNKRKLNGVNELLSQREFPCSLWLNVVEGTAARHEKKKNDQPHDARRQVYTCLAGVYMHGAACGLNN